MTDYIYPDNWVLVSCLSVITMLGWLMYSWLLNCMINCMIKTFFYFSLPFLFVCMFYVWFFSFCDDHQFIDVSSENSSWLSGWWRFRCLACLGSDPLTSEFSFRVVAYVLPCSLSIYFEYCWTIILVNDIMVCLNISL